MEDNVPEQALLSGNLEHMSTDKAVKMVRELCKQLGADADNFHGNIWPGNIRFDWDGRAILGDPSGESASGRLPEQAEYLAPEFLWEDAGSAASDVYSLALLLYCALTKGKLPFQSEETAQDHAEALRRRMKGESILIPSGGSPLFTSILGKALSFDPENRYISPAEFLAALNETDEALPASPPEEYAVYAAIAADVKPAEPEEAADTVPDEPAVAEAEQPEVPAPVVEETPAETAPDPPAEPADTPPEIPVSAPPPEETELPPLPQYSVEKDFEKRGHRKVSRLPATVKKTRRKKTPVIPLLCVLAVLVIAAVVYICFFTDAAPDGGDTGKETVSAPYVIELNPEPTPIPAAETAAPEPVTTESEETATGEIDTTAEPSAEVETPAPEDTVTITSEANVRSGPGTGYDVLEIAPVGRTYPLLGTVDTWYRVDVNGTTGYINHNMAAVSGSAETEQTFTLTVVSDVNIRLGAGTGYDILGVAYAGSELTAIGPEENGWYPITYGESGLYAYVAAALVTEK